MKFKKTKAISVIKKLMNFVFKLNAVTKFTNFL